MRSVLEDHLDIVGNLPDREVAGRAGVTTENVRSWRVRRGIPARWRGETEADAKVTKSKAGAGKKSKKRPSKLDAFEHLLGIAADATIADFAGLKVSSISVYRRRKGVPAPPGPKGKPPGHRKSKLDPHLHLLGQETDARIAELANVSHENVRRFRTRHGIPSARDLRLTRARPARGLADEVTAAAEAPRTPAKVARTPQAKVVRVAPPQPPTETEQQWAFRIVTTAQDNTREYIVVAVDIAQAAAAAAERLAAANASARLDSIKRLTEVL